MGDFSLRFDWVDPEGARGEELRATWARLEMSAGGQVITHLEDLSVRGTRDWIFLPLYPLAEWIATNWWSLLHEVGSDFRIAAREYGGRHEVSHASEGFALPSLRFQPEGSRVLVAWEPAELPWFRVRYLSHGAHYVPRSELEHALGTFVQAIVDRLSDLGVSGTFLQDEWTAIRRLEPEEQEFARAAGRLGCDPNSISQPEADAILGVGSSLDLGVRDEFLSLADLHALARQTQVLARALDDAASSDAELVELVRLRREGLPVPENQPPWEQGYALAQELRRRLGLNGEVVSSLAHLGKALRSDERQWGMAGKLGSPDLPVDAAMALTAKDSPSFVLRRREDSAQVFALCRAVLEYLVPAAPGDRAAIVAATHSERQKRNRAFAAEFLAPANAVRDRLRGGVVTEDDLVAMASELGVSTYVIRHQVENHKLARIETW